MPGSALKTGKAKKGAAATENKGAKGHAFDRILSGDSCVLLAADGPGIIDRIWLTVDERDPEMLRSLIIKMYWDGSDKPAVSVPLGEFFCNGLNRLTVFENSFFPILKAGPSTPVYQCLSVSLPVSCW